jgi:hypothetical protein
MFQLLPIFTIVALGSMNFYCRTGQVDVGSFINAMMVTWMAAAGQAPHFSLEYGVRHN